MHALHMGWASAPTPSPRRAWTKSASGPQASRCRPQLQPGRASAPPCQHAALVKVNDQLKAQIVDIREGRVFLSLKALKEDPWEKIGEQFKAGDTVQGRVYKFNPFGAVVALDGNLQGMVHISEFGGQEEMKQALIIGQSYPFVIDSIRSEEKRIILKLKK